MCDLPFFHNISTSGGSASGSDVIISNTQPTSQDINGRWLQILDQESEDSNFGDSENHRTYFNPKWL